MKMHAVNSQLCMPWLGSGRYLLAELKDSLKCNNLSLSFQGNPQREEET